MLKSNISDKSLDSLLDYLQTRWCRIEAGELPNSAYAVKIMLDEIGYLKPFAVVQGCPVYDPLSLVSNLFGNENHVRQMRFSSTYEGNKDEGLFIVATRG